MKRALRKNKFPIFYYKDGKKYDEVPSDVRGDLTGVRGYLTGVRGYLTGVRGYLTGVRGYLTGVEGYLDDCELSDEDRKNGVRISDLIIEEQLKLEE